MSKKMILFFAFALTLFSCTENAKVKNFGGSADITLEANQKLLNVTWKETDMWYLTRPMRKDDSAETYVFQEKSSFGIMQGQFIIHEIKTKQ